MGTSWSRPAQVAHDDDERTHQADRLRGADRQRWPVALVLGAPWHGMALAGSLLLACVPAGAAVMCWLDSGEDFAQAGLIMVVSLTVFAIASAIMIWAVPWHPAACGRAGRCNPPALLGCGERIDTPAEHVPRPDAAGGLEEPARHLRRPIMAGPSPTAARHPGAGFPGRFVARIGLVGVRSESAARATGIGTSGLLASGGPWLDVGWWCLWPGSCLNCAPRGAHMGACPPVDRPDRRDSQCGADHLRRP